MRTRLHRWIPLAIFLLLTQVVVQTATAMTPPYAPVDRPGPPLSVPAARLDIALRCSPSVPSAQREPILLLPGTTLTPAEFSWNYVSVFRDLGWPYCTVELPANAMDDIQVAAEYVVHAIRTMHARTGKKVQIVGHSQGGMVPRWGLRFWPDTRALVDDLVGLAPSNHGTLDADAVCLAPCAAAISQQRPSSRFLHALNSTVETFPGIDYTNVYSRLDEVVVPNFGAHPSSALRTGEGRIRNIATQNVCALNLAEHITTGTSDATAYAIAHDALAHPGPADPRRVSRTACARLLMPGVDPIAFPANAAGLAAMAATALLTSDKIRQEPPLRCYVYATGC